MSEIQLLSQCYSIYSLYIFLLFGVKNQTNTPKRCPTILRQYKILCLPLPTINCTLLHIQNTLHLAEKALSILYNNS